jgi:hypothetical protein
MKTLLLFLTVLISLNVQAQWTTDTAQNTLVVDSEGGDMKAIGTSDGKTYVVFWKVVAPPTNYELRMQVLDVNGNQTLGSDGILVSNTIPMSTFTVIWNITLDEDDNNYIGVTGTGSGNPAIVFKLDSTGTHLWPSSGVNVGSGFVPTILPLSSGEAIVSWAPGSEALLQKYDAAGTAVWGSAQPIVNAGNDTSPGNMFELAGGDFVMIFHSLIGGINSNLFAQRYDASGTPQWGSPTQLSNQATAFNRSYGGLQDGDTIYYGYFGSTGVRFDSFVQRINADGSLPWGINGSDFDITQSNYEMSTAIANELGSQSIWAICTATNTSQSEKGEYVQKFDKDTGARGLGDGAKVVYAISGDDNVHAGILQLKNDSPLFLHKSGFDNGVSPTTLGVVYLDENGDFVWPEESRPVATFPANKSRIQYTKAVNNQSVAVFIEEKASEPKIYAQNFLDEDLGTADHDFEDSLVYTNPVVDELQIVSGDLITGISVCDIMGRVVYSEVDQRERQISMATNAWASGIYVVRVVSEKGLEANLKIVKQ